MSNRDLALPTRGLERSRKASEGGHFRGREREKKKKKKMKKKKSHHHHHPSASLRCYVAWSTTRSLFFLFLLETFNDKKQQDMVTLTSADDEKFEVPVKVAKMSTTVDNMMKGERERRSGEEEKEEKEEERRGQKSTKLRGTKGAEKTRRENK